jgi:hypothetical protein
MSEQIPATSLQTACCDAALVLCERIKNHSCEYTAENIASFAEAVRTLIIAAREIHDMELGR